MRRRTYRAAFAWVYLGLFFLVGVTPVHGLILCRVPGEHVAIEDAVAAARCHATGTVRPASELSYEGTIVLSSSACVDTPLIPAFLRSPQIGFSQALGWFAPFTVSTLIPPVPPVEFQMIERRTPFAHDGALRSLRSVILLV